MSMSEQPFVITVGHQLGSGAALVGQKLAERLAIPFVDRDILKNVAARLHLPETELQDREQRLRAPWEALLWAAECLDPGMSVFADQYVPTDQELFEFESEYIAAIAAKKSAIFLGRCGQYILRRHPRHFKLLVYADPPARLKRLGELYHLSPAEAEKKLDQSDRERAAYIQQFTRQNWLAPQLYDLCINTSTLGVDKTVEIVLACVEAKFRPA
jgi:CMP/dCMP kinase